MTGRGMGDAPLGFAPKRVDRGGSSLVVVGSSGELVRVTSDGSPMHPAVRPFPASVTGGAVLDEVWVGTWVERELQQARMAALPLEGDWGDGAGREILRISINSARDVMPSSSVWSEVLDAEPLAVSRVGDGLVFATLGRGVYRTDADAGEIWRAPYPEWPGLSRVASRDALVSSNQSEDGVVVWSEAGGMAVLDCDDGSSLLSRELSLPDRLEGVRSSDDGEWLLMLSGGGVILLGSLESEPEFVRTPGPVMDAVHDGSHWRWTGWRHDGELFDGAPLARCVARDEVGVALIGDRVLTNDGGWDDIRV